MNQTLTGRARRRRRPRVSPGNRVLGVLGEVLLTLAVVVLLFVVWELWWTNIDAAQTRKQVSNELVQTLREVERSPGREVGEGNHGPPPVTEIGAGETFGIMYFPQFGRDGIYSPVTSGVGPEVIDGMGIGHYPQTQPPGEPGNFAVAAHRQTHGQVFRDIDKLGPGDQVYLQTRDGYYTYTWRETEIVPPSAAQVLQPVPHRSGAQPSTSILTMTSCHPLFSTRERIIAYSEMTGWRPLAAGPPDEIRQLVEKATT